MLKKLLLALALLLPTTALAGGNFAPVSASTLGFSSAQNLNGGVTSNAIDMGATLQTGYFTKITLLMTIVWGTSVIMNVTGQYSYDGTNYFDITRCTSDAIHDCGKRTWQWEPADGTTPSLDYPTNAPYLKFTFDDPGAGTGTVVVSAVRGK